VTRPSAGPTSTRTTTRSRYKALDKELARAWANTPPAPRELYQEGHCRSHPDLPPDAWFPAQAMGMLARQARAVCRSCPVRDLCLAWALEAQIADGIWGGTSPSDRTWITAADVPATNPRRVTPVTAAPFGRSKSFTRTLGDLSRPVNGQRPAVDPRPDIHDGCHRPVRAPRHVVSAWSRPVTTGPATRS
jgi:WhiB family redox-sensing transcriptional regulator